ncbi:hypothetical protein 7F23_26 [uncultured Caudovirales phage]|uniref:SHOCT domain-containing protein n=1 Tax=uncultured Caudovirales phage TaxID=2100421 RepID=A0A2H4J3P1_9CAUD|nr:hypothetical protein 7F23_26 [uncultured Caudovirales phage]
MGLFDLFTSKKSKKDKEWEEEREQKNNWESEIGDAVAQKFGFNPIVFQEANRGRYQLIMDSRGQQSLYVNTENNMFLFVDSENKDYFCFNGQDILKFEMVENTNSTYSNSTGPMSNRSSVSTTVIPIDIRFNFTLKAERPFISFIKYENNSTDPRFLGEAWFNSTLNRYHEIEKPKALEAEALLLGLIPQKDSQSTSTSSSSNGLSVSDELVRLKQLKDEGILSEEEFTKAKSKLLQ